MKESTIVSFLCVAVYGTTAYLLDFKYLIFPGDAMSRMANGFYVVFSRDPHLGAFGFVWPPLTSAIDLFFLLFKGIWPVLSTRDVAGSLTTVLAMTGAVFQIRAILSEWGVRRLPRLLLVATFALSPMVIFYSANGMSEAIYLFTLVAATRYLLRWMRDDTDIRSLVYCAAFLGLAFLGRNEATAAALGASLLVAGVTFCRSAGPFRHRAMRTMTDLIIVSAPFMITFIGWALAGWVLTGQLLPQYAANALQVSLAGIARSSHSSRLVHELHAISAMTPLLPVAAVLAFAIAAKRKDAQPLAVLAIVGGSQAFSLYAYYAGSIFPWFRFYLPALPIEILLVGYALSRPRDPVVRPVTGNRNRDRRNVQLRHAWLSVVGAIVVIAVATPSIPVSGRAMLNPSIAPEESQDLGFIVHRHLTQQDRQAKDHYAAILTITRYIAHMHLPDGTVVVDNTNGCIPETIVTSPNPKVFVIPNDRDYQRVLAAPKTFHARYILDPKPTGLDAYGEINQLFPQLFQGPRWTQLVHDFPAAGQCPEFHLFRVIEDPGLVS